MIWYFMWYYICGVIVLPLIMWSDGALEELYVKDVFAILFASIFWPVFLIVIISENFMKWFGWILNKRIW